MEIIEKMQTLQAVIDGKQHPAVLKELLPEPDVQEHNWIKETVEQAVALRLQQAAANKQQFRLKMSEMVPDPSQKEEFEMEVVDSDGNPRKVKAMRPKMVEKAQFSDWYPEVTQFSAPQLIGQFRQRFPKAAISIERE